MFNKFRLIAILMYLPLLLAVGLVFFGTMDQAWKSPWGFIHAGIAAVFILVCCTFGTIFLIISTQRTPEHYSIFSALCHFLVKYYQLYIGYKMLRTFRASCENPRKVQENLLTKIIMHNKDTDHGRKFHLCCINSLEDLRKKHTITDYSRYETFVERICKGEKNVLTTENVSRLILTSGTTGKGKRIPQNGYSAYWQMVLQEALQQEMFPDLDPMQSKLKIHCNSQIIKSECGITISSALAIEPRMLKYMVVYSSPANSFMISNLREATYVHLLFALRDRNLGSIFATFSSVFLEAMEYLEANWQKLVNDITKGTLNQELRLAPYIRRSLERHLGSGDHRRAMEVKKECEKGFDGLLKRLWPHLQFVSTIDNVGLRGTLKGSIAKGIEVYSPLYVSSETLMGMNLWPFGEGEAEYVLNLVENVFEFIQEDEMDMPSPQTFFVDEIEVGQNYELIFSQRYGLYRYRFGDVIKVSGFYKNCPKVKFLYRKATLLNLVGEKVDQTTILEAIQASLSRWANTVELSYYTVAENTLLKELHEGEAGSGNTYLFYVLFLELKMNASGKFPQDLQPHTLAQIIDRQIYENHTFYRNFKDTDQIALPRVYFVKTGAFLQLKEFILQTTSSSRSQFKMPLKLRTSKMAEIMLANVMH